VSGVLGWDYKYALKFEEVKVEVQMSSEYPDFHYKNKIQNKIKSGYYSSILLYLSIKVKEN
jgi:hypothetical protein